MNSALPQYSQALLSAAIKSADGSGHLTWDEIEPVLKIDPPYYQAATGLICLENTHNFAGGSVMTAEACADVCKNAHAMGLPVHMDGARISMPPQHRIHRSSN